MQTGMQAGQLQEPLSITRWLTTAAEVLCPRGVVLCVDRPSNVLLVQQFRQP